MRGYYEKLFNKIMARIDKEERLLKMKRRLCIFAALFAASAAALLPSLKMAAADFSQTGFAAFLSLALSDADIVMKNSGVFLSALLESLPVFSVTAVLAALFALLQSLKFLSRDIKFIHQLT